MFRRVKIGARSLTFLVCATTSVGVLSLAPSRATGPVPTVHVQDGGDGYINASESGTVVVTGTYDKAAGVTSVIADIASAGPSCSLSSAAVAAKTAAVNGTTGTFSITFDVSSLPEGKMCGRARTTTDGNWGELGVSDNQPTKDTVGPGAPKITSPEAASDQREYFAIAGSAEPASTVQVWENRGTPAKPEAIGGTAIASDQGAWSIAKARMTASGTHAIWAAAVDRAGNRGADSELLTFDVDTLLPSVTIDTGGGMYGLNAEGPIIFTGTAKDTPDTVGGVLGVEVTIWDNVGMSGDVKTGHIALGAPVLQQEACPECGGRLSVGWTFEVPSSLPPGSYTANAVAIDTAGNRSPVYSVGFWKIR